MPTKTYHFRVFCSPGGGGGNCHTVIFNPAPSPTALKGKWVVVEHDRVRHFDNGSIVRRCGSGSLALALALYQHLGRPFERRLATDSGPLTVGYDHHGPYYIDTPLPLRPSRHPGLWTKIIRARLRCSYDCGKADEYCLVHLAPGADLHKVQIRSRLLTGLSRRALILIAGEAPNPQMRYFAPQYGAAEDSATGSAAVQLAHYFWHIQRQQRLTIEQKSPQGGYIQTQAAGGRRIKIRGLWR